MLLKEDVLQCTTAELSYGLCCFISEVKRPNGTPYTPDSLFYLCLGIQQYLFENGRVENIFMDQFYNKFSAEFTCMLKDFKPSVTASVKQRSNVFYLLPERCCVPNSPLWFSTTPLDDSTMEAMLIRILSVRDLHVRTKVVK
ncbi:hypothetical protein fugu_018311 [Takifugu bimaculatus]|uniref:Uncharacterized protein n=1 Tax=Takifugu bimaculatus TaxID=433685 RepID=A0A4Z2BLL2_9TELE|nr:hypothetical protein fugu_018311 [Takifugu bimaculatus]